MYTPALFQLRNRDEMFELVEQSSFGLLVVPGDDVDLAHVPFVLDRDQGENGGLRVHVARANPIAKRALAAGRATAVFAGPHGYVSPRWYEHPDAQVPTWNYLAVHAHARVIEMSSDELLRLLDDLSAIHERGAAEPWTVDRLAPQKRDQLLQAIVGLHLHVERLEGKAKLSQNRTEEDRRRVMAALQERAAPDDLAMLGWMKRG